MLTQTCLMKYERRKSASQTMGKLFLEAALIILECGLWSPVCSHLKHRPQSPQMAVPGSFQQLASALLCPSGPSPNHRLALSPRAVQAAVVWLQDHPCPSSHTELFLSHLYSDLMDRQICFCQLWLPDWEPDAAMWPDARTL